MTTKNQFFEMLDNYQDYVIDHVLNYPKRLLLVKGVKFIGKTTTVCKIFNEYDKTPIIYHTGCDPTKREIAHKHFVKILDTIKNDCLVILDEFFYKDTCEYFNTHKNFKCILFVNSSKEFAIPGFDNFDLKQCFETFKTNFFKYDSSIDWKDRNIREITYFYDNPNFDKNDFNNVQQQHEAKRSQSNRTQTKIKINNKIEIQTITFDKTVVVEYE